jgi:hypothetical protein
MPEKSTLIAVTLLASAVLAGCATNEAPIDSPEPEPVSEPGIYRFGVEGVDPGRLGAVMSMPHNAHVLHFGERYTLSSQADAQADSTSGEQAASVEAEKEAPQQTSAAPSTHPRVSGDLPMMDKAHGDDATAQPMPANPSGDYYERTGTLPPK